MFNFKYDLQGKNAKYNLRVNMMKFSWAIGWVKWLSGEKTNVSKTISVLVLRVLV